MVLKTLHSLGPLHGYGIARRIEQTSGDLLAVNYGTLYPALLKLEQEGYISSEWDVSDNKRKAKYYKLTRAGKKQLAGMPHRVPRSHGSERYAMCGSLDILVVTVRRLAGPRRSKIRGEPVRHDLKAWLP